MNATRGSAAAGAGAPTRMMASDFVKRLDTGHVFPAAPVEDADLVALHEPEHAEQVLGLVRRQRRGIALAGRSGT